MFLLAEPRRGAPRCYPFGYVPEYRVRIRSCPFDLYQRGLGQEIGRAHGMLATAVSHSAFAQAAGIVRRAGTVVLNGLPTATFRCRSCQPRSMASPCVDRSSGRDGICRRSLNLQPRVGYARAFTLTARKTSAACSPI